MNSCDLPDDIYAFFRGETAVSGIHIGTMNFSETAARFGAACLECHGRCYNNEADVFLMMECGRHLQTGDEVELTVWADDANPGFIIYVHDNRIFTATEIRGEYEVRHRYDMRLIEQKKWNC